ncbi:MAG: 3-isopropylmalate dehydratase, partial [Comamonadaceae bacterium]
MSAQSLAQKLIARAAGRDAVRVGEIVTCRVDLAMFHDSSGPRRLQPMLEQLGAGIWDKSRVVLVMDHYVPERTEDARRIVRIARDWARDQQLPHVYDSIGICHVVVPQHGHIRPGMFCVGGDSHSPTGGAFGAYMFGIGSTEMLGVVTTGEIWVQVPRTIRMEWSGRLARGVAAKDMMLAMLGRFGMNGGAYQAVEFAGDAVRALPMPERMTLANMSAELGAPWFSDPGSADEVHAFDATALAPQVAAPFSPANTAAAARFAGIAIQAAYIGACTGATSRRTPASHADRDAAQQEGTLQVLADAGAQMLPSACGVCAGYGDSFAAGETVISSTARNFKGRMGPPGT